MAQTQDIEDVLSSIRRLVATDNTTPAKPSQDVDAPKAESEALVLAPTQRVTEPEDPFQTIQSVDQDDPEARNAESSSETGSQGAVAFSHDLGGQRMDAWIAPAPIAAPMSDGFGEGASFAPFRHMAPSDQSHLDQAANDTGTLILNSEDAEAQPERVDVGAVRAALDKISAPAAPEADAPAMSNGFDTGAMPPPSEPVQAMDGEILTPAEEQALHRQQDAQDAGFDAAAVEAALDAPLDEYGTAHRDGVHGTAQAAEEPPVVDAALWAEDEEVIEDGLAELEVDADERLRELIADVVREELSGELGERITRNVRKLVRREVRQLLTSDEFD